MQSLDILVADLGEPTEGEAVVRLIDEYAQDPMGRGEGLGDDARARLVRGLADCRSSLVLLAREEDTYVGVAVCFTGFSTFAGKPLLNVHDLAVTSSHRGRGIGRRLLDAAEHHARALGCSKLTLEVRCDNQHAQRLYTKLGYGECAPPMLFWFKPM